MPTPPHPAALSEIYELLQSINQAWLYKRGDSLTHALTPCFAEDIVMRGPAFSFLGKGRAFAIQSFHDFVAHSEVQDFSTDPPQIDLLGDTATAQYKWKMTYALSRQEYTEQGNDLYILAHQSGRWQVIWRAMLPDPPPRPS